MKNVLAVNDAMDRRLRRDMSVDGNRSSVDSALHRRIMNRVSRSAEPNRRSVSSLTLAAGALAVMVAFVGTMMFQTPVDPAATLPARGFAQSAVSATLKQHIARLETAPVLPEAALREEYERLKSDLRKLGIES